MSFDIIRSDLWTSPALSSSSHRYYVLFVDDYSIFMWTFERDIKTIQCDNGTKFDNGPFGIFIKPMVFRFVFHVLIHLLKMGKSKNKFVRSTTLFIPYWLMFLFLLHFGIMLCK